MNYDGSIAQRKMNFNSEVEVVVNENNEVFNRQSIYIPASFAFENIVDWLDFAEDVTATRPAVFTVDVTNFTDVMSGDLLTQYQDIFRQATNADVVLFLIVFDDTASFTVGATSIVNPNLSAAFNALYFISYNKMLYDPDHSGADVVIPYAGTFAKRTISITNGTESSITLPADDYLYNDGVFNFAFTVLAPIIIPASGVLTGIVIEATEVGVDANIAVTSMSTGDFTPALAGTAADLTFLTTAHVDGTDQNLTPSPVASKYFDFSLALAQLCRDNISLSLFWSLVRVVISDTAFPVTTDTDPNNCFIRSKDAAAQQTWMTALNKPADGSTPIPRSNYYWGALYLLGCQNTCVIAHSEPDNIWTEVFAAWFGGRNASGQYVANKLSQLRLSGTTIKPFGWPSWLNDAVNINDSAGFDILDTMFIGYLETIADDTAQDCALSQARTVTGLAVNALMIAKFVDYKNRQDMAKFITDSGTLANPVLTDEDAYKTIQNTVLQNLLLFASNANSSRIFNIVMNFPPFSVAKTGLTQLEAASAWTAQYRDDLTEVTVSGGITEQ